MPSRMAKRRKRVKLPVTHRPKNLDRRIRDRFAPFGFIELELPERTAARALPDFTQPEYGLPEDD